MKNVEKCVILRIKEIAKMTPIINISMSIFSNLIYDVLKHLKLRVFSYKRRDEKKLKESVANILYNHLPDDCLDIVYSDFFLDFFQSPQTLDTIQSYFNYKILGEEYNKILEIKQQAQKNFTIDIKDLISYLTNNLLSYYQIKNFPDPPSRSLLDRIFNTIFDAINEFLASNLTEDSKNSILLANARFDDMCSRMLQEFKDLLSENLSQKFIPTIADYQEIKQEYYDILKEKNSVAHIYLLDKFPFGEFYVPPILEKSVQGNKPFFRRYSPLREKDMMEQWRNIFNRQNIIYITGGAGYGKSLFTKKIINDYSKLNIPDIDEYIVIYGELKNFYPNKSNTPVSVVEFLQQSMKTSTLLDESKLSQELIEYFLKRGRCIILLDALDEVEKTKRQELHETIIPFFKKQNPNNKVCITSRDRGFIPEKDIEVFNICPLTKNQIQIYLDKIIALGKFEKSDKSAFLEKADKLIQKNFLNSFLVLSLLINIYKAELELPENKLDLYQKCFEYIAQKRERLKTENSFNWSVIAPIMKENTFIELAALCFPNNTDVEKSKIRERLLQVYKSKYNCEADTENAIEEFLKFCSDRTELFVLSTEDKYKFFHRSFFEYFYSMYIFLNASDANAFLEKLLNFDVDSEVFELTIAMLKQKSETKYQAVIELLLNTAKSDFENKKSNFSAFNILLLSMQVIDDALYRKEFLQMFVDYKTIILRKLPLFHNQNLLFEVFRKEELQPLLDCYYNEGLISLLNLLCASLRTLGVSIVDDDTGSFDFPSRTEHDYSFYFSCFGDRKFFERLFLKTQDCKNVLEGLSKEDLQTILATTKMPHLLSSQIQQTLIAGFDRYLSLDEKRKKRVFESILALGQF